jgi:hypothetical protein
MRRLQVRSTGIEVLVLPDHTITNSAIGKITAVGGKVYGQGRRSRGDDRARPHRDAQALARLARGDQRRRAALFLLSMGGGAARRAATPPPTASSGWPAGSTPSTLFRLPAAHTRVR